MYLTNNRQIQSTVEKSLPLSTLIDRQVNKLQFNNVFNDQDTCGVEADLVYSLIQVNYPGLGDFNPELFSFDSANRKVLFAESSTIPVNKHTAVV